MLNIGYHESISAGWGGLVDVALNAGGNTFAFFTRNPRAAFSDKNIIPNDKAVAQLALLKKKLCDNNFAPVVAHAPYTANPCSEDAIKREGAWGIIKSDVDFMAKYLPGNLYNFHPGSPKSLGTAEGVKQTGAMLIQILQSLRDNGSLKGAPCNNSGESGTNSDSKGATNPVTILIETMAGKGSEIGRTFEEIRDIIEYVEEKFGDTAGALGVCFDTCHVWDAGYDIKNKLDEVLILFDNIVGLNRIRAIHLNDSKNPCGARKDRHERIGLGFIGFEALKRVIKHNKFQNLPIILETPNDENGWKEEIAALKKAYSGERDEK